MNAHTLTSEHDVQLNPEDVREILDEIAQSDCSGHGRAARNRILARVDLAFNDGTKTKAMIRDQSRTGLGFVHDSSIPCGNATVTVGAISVRKTFAVRIAWCKKIQDDVFFSGAYYVIANSASVATKQPNS